MRFPEFKGEWKTKAIGEITQSFSGGTPKSTDYRNYNGEIPFIRSGEIDKETTALHLSKAGLKGSSVKLVSKGDLLLALYGATSGKIAISKIDGAINQAILCLRTNVDKNFFKSQWEAKVESILRTYLQGGQGNLSSEIVQQIKFGLPGHEEQEKIGDLMRTIDDRISVQRKTIEVLETLKESIVRRRKTGNKKLKEYCQAFSSNIKENEVSKTGRYPVFGANGLVGYRDSYQFSTPGIAIIKDGAGVGRCTPILDPLYSVLGTMTLLTPANKCNSIVYLYYLLQAVDYSRYVVGSGIPHIYFKDYSQALVPEESQQTLCLSNLYMSLCNKQIQAKKELLSISQLKSFLLSSLFM